MDLVLEAADTFLFDWAYASVFPKSLTQGHNGTQPLISEAMLNFGAPTRERYGLVATHIIEPSAYAFSSAFGRDAALRQALTLFIVTTIFGWVLYLGIASLAYKFVYDPANFDHPRYLKNQISMEIHQAVTAIPVMTLLTVPWFVAECQGFGKLYFDVEEKGWTYFLFQFPLFLVFTDCLIYMIHRALHHKSLYKHLHKPHHKWIVPTPYASHAFHPVDGYLQSVPYHLFPFIFPLHKAAYVVLFAVVNIWTVSIHDGDFLANDPVVNGSACHTIHHLYFNYNYGQYTTLWDRLGGTYRVPEQEMFNAKTKLSKATISSQVKKMDIIRDEVEGKNDFREYISASSK